jgi:TatD DNase family protein
MAKTRPPIPVFSESIIETHCHLDYLKEHTFEHTISECKRVGISHIITISVSPDNLETVRELTLKDSMIYGTQGIHPHQASTFNEDVYQEIDKHLNDEKILAVGEIGLDYYYNKSPKEAQQDAFSRQLELAIKHNLPVVIHSRDADDDMIKILKEYAPQMNKKGVIHSFTSGEELAKVALNLGFFLGFNGIITFKNAQNVRDILAITPLEKIIIETDSPFLTPIPYRGVENNPFYLPFIAQKIADEKGMPVEEISKTTTKNAQELFFNSDI